MPNSEIRPSGLVQTRQRLTEILPDRRLKLAVDYREGKGKGDELILFLHGLGCSKDSFKDVWTRNDFKQYSILAPDFAGFGSSSKPEDWSYSMKDHAASVKKLLEDPRYKDKKVHIVAHSMGGAVGLLLAEQLENLGSVTLVEGNLIREDCGLISRGVSERSYDEFQRKDGFFDEIRNTFSTIDDQPGAQLWIDWSRRANPYGFYESARSLVEESDSGNLLEIFEALPVPKAYIYGDKNDDMPVLQKLQEINRHMIENSGHFVMNDNPNAFYSRLLNILNQRDV